MNGSTPSERATKFRSLIILVDRFQPFQSRIGLDTVIRLQFEYDAALVARLKALLAVYVVRTGNRTIGGWLPKHSCWFVESEVWDVIKMELLYLGHRIVKEKS